MSKELKVRYVPSENLFEIYYEGGGGIPDALKGYYTTTAAAQENIKLFQATVRDKVENRGKSVRGS